MPTFPDPSGIQTPWSTAVKLVAQWLETHERVDLLLEGLPSTLKGAERGNCQSLLYGVVRHFGRIDRQIERMIARPPRPRLKAILLVAGYELIEGGDEHHAARVGHHAVEQAKTLASEAEARLVNAVVRKLAAALAAEEAPSKLATAEVLAGYFSHPEWLVQRWLAQFGAQATRQLLEWNQRPAQVYARWRNLCSAETGVPVAKPDWLKPTEWPDFFEIESGHWTEVSALMADGVFYIQDPSTRLAIELLAPQPGESLLDLCAAPGGKSLAVADAVGRAAADSLRKPPFGQLVALDLPGERIERLEQNLAKIKNMDVALVQGDLAHGVMARLLGQHVLPELYAGVLLDVPCSNSGVMRHRVDVKWRLRESDFAKHAEQQLALLAAASCRVADGGRLVYSTCSLDAEENDRVITEFLGRAGGRFVLEKSIVARPWEARHDGAAAFLLRRKN